MEERTALSLAADSNHRSGLLSASSQAYLVRLGRCPARHLAAFVSLLLMLTLSKDRLQALHDSQAAYKVRPGQVFVQALRSHLFPPYHQPFHRPRSLAAHMPAAA